VIAPPRKLALLLDRIDLIDELSRGLAYQRRTKLRVAFLKHIRSELARLRDELVELQRAAWIDDDKPKRRRKR
jgi:hypothetical protein